MIRNKKGQIARAFIYIISLLALLGIVYQVFSPVIENFQSQNLLPANSMFTDTMNLIFQSWAKWPLIVVFGLVILTVIISSRGTPQRT